MIYLLPLFFTLIAKYYFMYNVLELKIQPLFFINFITSDLGYMFFYSSLLGINYYLKQKKKTPYNTLYLLIKIFVILMSILYIIDTCVIMLFYSRLYIDYFFSFLNIKSLKNIQSNYFIYLAFIIILAILIRCSATLKINKKLLFTLICLSISSYTWTYTQDKNRWSILSQDLISVNINSNSSIFELYSKKFKNKFIWKPDIYCQKKIPLQKPDNILMILFESWSYKHSKFFGGNESLDWTPFLDGLAKENISLNNFYANGYMTEHGLFSLMTGMLPFFYSEENNLDISMDQVIAKPSIVNLMNQNNYQTTFFSGAPKFFLNKDNWLNRLGFQDIIDNSNFAKEEQKYIFNAVSDKKLYEKVNRFLKKQPTDNFIVIENTQTHVPFYVPSSKKRHEISEEKTFKYTDRVIADFIKKHQTSNNLFIIVSDHRIMQSTTIAEEKKSGTMAASRIPAFIIWKNKNIEINQAFSQVDIYNLLKRWITGEKCHSLIHGQIYPFDTAEASKCQFFTRGDNRSYITVKCDNKIYHALLDGDNTRIDKKTGKMEKEIINWINWSRLRHDK